MKSKKFFDRFPPPEFLSIPYTGLCISDAFVRCIRLQKRGDKLRVLKYVEQIMPKGMVVSGQIIDIPGLTQVLEGLKKEINLEYVRVSLPEEKAYLFTTKIPIVADSDVRTTVEFTIEENVPLPAAELVFDYTVTPTPIDEDHVEAVVSAIPNTIVDSYIEAIRGAGITVLSLEVESQAIARAVLPYGNCETVLIMHFGKDKVGMYIVYNRVVQFTSTVAIREEDGDAHELVSQEVKRLYAYWHTLKKNLNKEDKQITRVIICGKSFNENIVQYISVHNGVHAELGNVWINVFDINKEMPQIPFEDSLRYASVIGLALPTNILI